MKFVSCHGSLLLFLVCGWFAYRLVFGLTSFSCRNYFLIFKIKIFIRSLFFGNRLGFFLIFDEFLFYILWVLAESFIILIILLWSLFSISLFLRSILSRSIFSWSIFTSRLICILCRWIQAFLIFLLNEFIGWWLFLLIW